MPRKRIWKPAEIALLGTVSDATLANRLGISAAAVCHLRHARRIPAYRKQYRAWGVTELTMLGRYGDGELARITGRPLTEVIEKRLEIQSGDRRRPKQPPPKKKPPRGKPTQRPKVKKSKRASKRRPKRRR